MSAQSVIDIKGLSKRYGESDHLALNDLTISINQGEVYGFLGPNGAGKSTAIRTLMNFLQPTSGTAKILNMDVVFESVKIKEFVGYLSGDFAIYPKMTGRQYLEYLGQLQKNGNLSYAKKLAKSFNADLTKKLGELSRGNRQKIGLIQALMHNPKVLILDEPTSGLDPLMQEVFYKLIKEAKQRNVTVFVSSHILSEVQKMCDRVGIIRDGRLVAEKVISDLVNEAAQTFDITFAKKVPVGELRKVRGLKLQNYKKNDATVHVHGHLSELFKVLSHHEVTKIDARNLDLEELFIHFYQNEGNKK